MKVYLRVLGLAGTAVIAASGLKGCASGPCLEYQTQVITRQVCDSRSSTGWCTASHPETSTVEVCVRRGKGDAASAGDPEARFEKSMATFKERAVEHYPPRSFESCNAMTGTWYAACARREGRKCLEASQIKGLCSDHVIPGVKTRRDCNAQGGAFTPMCLEWSSERRRCVFEGDVGLCRAAVAAERTVNLFHVLATGEMRNPNFLKPGKTRAAFDKEMKAYAPHFPPKSYTACGKLKGRWWGTCTRKSGDKCVRVSHTEGYCNHFMVPGAVTAQRCAHFDFPGREALFLGECAAWGVNADGKDVCERRAEFGKCVSTQDYPLRIPPGQYYHLRANGAIDSNPYERRW